MNHERMLKVADVIEANPEHFEMDWFLTRRDEQGNILPRGKVPLETYARDADLFECGTTACIAGWAVNLWGGEVKEGDVIEFAAADILGMDHETAGELFIRFDLDTAAKAAQHLRRMVAEDRG